MRNKTRLLNILNILLIILTILAALKMLFFGLGLDEEYQVVMAYRNARGDRLFLDMWEPHQSSAFLCSLLMKPYLKLLGTTGVVLYLRVWGTFFHLFISLYLYMVLKAFVRNEYARLLAFIYFNTIPKLIILPEFGIMQVWFYTLLSLFLIRYYTDGRKVRYLVLAALAFALNVLSYPSCVILFPFLLLSLFRFSGREKWRDMGIFTLVCTLCGAGYLGILFTYTDPKELVNTLSHILSGDITHSLSLREKLLSWLRDILRLSVLWAGCRLFALVFSIHKKPDAAKTYCLTLMAACGIVLFYWGVLKVGYPPMHIHLATAAAAGLIARAKARKIQKEAASKAENIPLFLHATTGAILSLLAVAYLTDLNLMESIPHAMPAAIYGTVLLILTLEQKETRKPSGWLLVMLTAWAFTAVFGKGYTLRGGAGNEHVLQSGGIFREGPAAGIISNYIAAYIYNSDWEDWQTYLQDGDSVLIMVDQLSSLGTIQYLFKDVEISHFSIVNPTAYDERLPEYWTLYPEKFPNVIIVDCWYGELMTDPGNWMMRYIEDEFGYTQVNDGKYIRIYRK